MNLRPLNDMIVVQRKAIEAKSKGGIFIPEQAQEKTASGVVVAVGPGIIVDGIRQPLDVAKGDEILFGKYSGSEITLHGEEYVMLHEHDVLGVDAVKAEQHPIYSEVVKQYAEYGDQEMASAFSRAVDNAEACAVDASCNKPIFTGMIKSYRVDNKEVRIDFDDHGAATKVAIKGSFSAESFRSFCQWFAVQS